MPRELPISHMEMDAAESLHRIQVRRLRAEIERLRAALEPKRLADIIGSRFMGNLNEQSILDEAVKAIRADIDLEQTPQENSK